MSTDFMSVRSSSGPRYVTIQHGTAFNFGFMLDWRSDLMIAPKYPSDSFGISGQRQFIARHNRQACLIQAIKAGGGCKNYELDGR